MIHKGKKKKNPTTKKESRKQPLIALNEIRKSTPGEKMKKMKKSDYEG
jgi:hypothetical protein